MNRLEIAEDALLEASRWQRQAAERLGIPLALWRGKPVAEPASRDTGASPISSEPESTPNMRRA